MEQYENVRQLLAKNPYAKKYYDTLPDYVQEGVQERSSQLRTFEQMCAFISNFTQGDR